MARARYRGESVPTRWDMLVGSKTSKEFLDAISASRTAERTQSTALLKAEQATASAKNRQARQSAVEAKIGQLKKEADNLVSAKTQKESAAQAKANNLASLQSSYSTQSQQLSAQKQSFQASLANVNSARDQTAAQIAQIDAENQRKAQAARAEAARKNAASGNSGGGSNSGGQGGGSGSGGSGGGGGGASGGGFLIPVIPRPLYVTSPFGMREYPFGGRWMHNGVDLRSPCGQAQVAPGNGVVASVRPAAGNSTHGNQVFINLGNVNGHSWVAVTNHMSAFNVRPGQSVTQGQVIGWTGQTGQVTGCHVHMEVWRDGQVINPMSLPGF